MLKTREIPRERWSEYFERVARQQRERPVRLEIISTPLGAQRLEEHAPLVDIGLEKKGSERGAIEVTVGGGNGQLLGHRVEKPARVFTEENESGEVEVIDIEDQEHTKTLVVFERPMALEA